MVAAGLDTSFVGRDSDVDELCRLLETRSLVTILGEGGVGKTRLARELTHESTAAGRSAYWIDLGSA